MSVDEELSIHPQNPAIVVVDHVFFIKKLIFNLFFAQNT